MRRKIIKQGAATLTVSLPAKWAKKLSIKPGHEVDVQEKGAELIVSSSKAPAKKTITVEISANNRADIKPILTHLYRRGFDTIVLNNVTSDVGKEITKITKDLLLGFEITEREGKQWKIASISEPTEDKYEVLLRRAFLIIKETEELIFEDFKKGTYSNEEQIENLRTQHDKFVLFCRRLISTSNQDQLLEWELLTFLMHIEHAYCYLYSYAADNKVKISDKTISLLENLEKYFQLFYDAYYKKNIQAIHELNKRKKEFQFGKCHEALSQAKGKETVIISYLREIFRLVQIGSSPVLSELFEAQLE